MFAPSIQPYPSFFVNACKCFFQLPRDMKMNQVDPFWNVTLKEICDGMVEAFERNWVKYIPSIDLNEEDESFLQKCERLHMSSLHPPVPIQKFLPQLTPSSTSSPAPILIGVTGEMRHGKSTVSEYLCQHHNFIEYSFAYPLKEGVKILFSLTDEQVYTELKDQECQTWKTTPRYLLRNIGTELFRDCLKTYIPKIMIKNSFWIDNFLKWYMQHNKYSVVVSDCRFPNEANALKELGAKLIRVQRPILNSQSSSHSSETQQKNIVVHDVIFNDGTIENLYEKVDESLKKFLV